MSAFKTKRDRFFGSEEAEAIKRKLEDMISSELYNTVTSYTADSLRYPDHVMPFVDRHINYLNHHPKLDARMYLANLRLMTRTKR